MRPTRERRMAPVTSTHTKTCMSERERVLAAIARIEAKLAAVTDEPSRFYYRQCLIGWRQHLARLG